VIAMTRLCFAILAVFAIGCGGGASGPMPDYGIAALQKTDTTVGNGAEAVTGSTVLVHYTGWLYDPAAADHHGKEFDSSRKTGSPFEFRIGAGDVIPGWDQGVAGMKVGGKRVLTIPPSLGYGGQGAADVIPPNATLVFEVELMGVK